MDENYQNKTLLFVLEQFRKKGYTFHFQVDEYGRFVVEKQVFFLPSEVELHEFHCFEAETDSANLSILYAVQTTTGIRGIFINTCGTEDPEKPRVWTCKFEGSFKFCESRESDKIQFLK
ncbi:hypothetical protein GM418_29665 [Maribellus comscasis]|uniref:Uncharacterized protein n=1 Tax=Maribellus comscasis TaxID=2681766 RepID=A0A6I6KBR1_9BACT|nr:hypothetical protein [Maribellus comscasis]QGY47684.1 hypothetical protein GM418_29665 [Maribellus comscasis]